MPIKALEQGFAASDIKKKQGISKLNMLQ